MTKCPICKAVLLPDDYGMDSFPEGAAFYCKSCATLLKMKGGVPKEARLLRKDHRK